MFEVYRHTSPSGKSYVGWTSQGWRKRWNKHVSDARKRVENCAAFYRAIRKYGADAFAHEVLERMTTEAGAKRAEQLWIRELGAFGANGYNLAVGGSGSMGHAYAPTAETRAKLSAAHTGRKHSLETRAKMSASRMGRKLSSESLAKSALGRRGKKRTPEQRERIRAGLFTKTTAAERSARARRAAQALWEKRRTNG